MAHGRFSLLLLLCLTLSVRAGGVFHMVYADYRPYSWQQDGKPAGLEYEVAQALLHDRLGLEVEHDILPWERAQQYVKQGKADALIATSNEERQAYAWQGGTAVSYWQMSAFVRRDDVRFQDGIDKVDALLPYQVGTELGNRWIPLHLAGGRISYTESVMQLPAMLAARRIDLIADDAMVIRNLLADSPLATQIVEIPLPGTRSPMYFMLGKQSAYAGLREKIDAALAEMARDGTLSRIQQRYRQSQ